MNFKYALHPKDYAIGQIEKYYTDMAAKGWHLKKHGAWVSKFEKGDPLEMKYRVEVYVGEDVPAVGLPEEQLAVYEDCGWEFVSKSGFINVFRAPAVSDTEEFYLDPAQQADTLKGLRKNMLANAVQLPVTLAILVLLNMLMGENMPAQIHLAWIGETWGLVGYIAIILAFCFSSVRGVFHLNKLYNNMKKGIPLDHSPKSQSRLPNIIQRCVMIAGIVLVARPFIQQPVPMPEVSDGMYVTFSELGIDEPRGVNFNNRQSEVSYSKSPFGQYWDTFEVLDTTTTWMYQEVFALKDEKLALKTAKALMNTSTFAQSEEKFSEMEFAGLEKVYCNSDLELVVINNGYVGYFTSIFTRETRTRLLTRLAEKWI